MADARTAPRQVPSRQGSAKGHGLTAQWHGIPLWLLGAGGLVFAYFLYEHFKSSSSSSSSATNPTTATTSTGYPYGYPGGTGNNYPTSPGQPASPPPTPVVTKPTTRTGSTSISTVTPTQTAQAQNALTASSTPISGGNTVTTASGQTTTTGQLAYQNLTSKGYSPQAASQAASQIAAANSGVPTGTPQLVAGTPVTSGSVSATNTNGMTPAQYAQQAAAAASQQQMLDARNGLNPNLGPSLAPSAPISPYSVQNGFWVNSAGQDVAKVNPNAFIGNGPNASNMEPL